MIDFQCPHCGKALHAKLDFAGRSGHCKRCGGEIRVPAPGANGEAPLTTRGEVERFGAYSKAADERWEDPSATREKQPAEPEAPVDLPEVPDDILEKHKALKHAHRKTLLRWSAIGGVSVLAVALVLFGLFYALRGEPAPSPPAPLPASPAAAQVPEAAPAETPESVRQSPAQEPAVTEPAQPAPRRPQIVYLDPRTQVYHTHSCPLRPELSTPLTIPQARQRGARACKECRPGE